jgi:hypothetical protein
MPQFMITCRADLDEGVIATLDAQGIYWYAGSTTQPGSKLRRHHLKVEAANIDEAPERARELIQAAGGDASDLTLLG